jgi:uncharacterized membrane protein YtjA (UPF0391 family)
MGIGPSRQFFSGAGGASVSPVPGRLSDRPDKSRLGRAAGCPTDRPAVVRQRPWIDADAGTAPRPRHWLHRHSSGPVVPPLALHQETNMLHYAVVFFVIALIAAVFGFTGLAAGAAGIAKTLFFVFLVLAVVSFVWNMLRGRT